jgi:hypothetical protein
MNLISAEIIKFSKKKNDITQDSSVVPTKINFVKLLSLKKERSAYLFWLE